MNNKFLKVSVWLTAAMISTGSSCKNNPSPCLELSSKKLSYLNTYSQLQIIPQPQSISFSEGIFEIDSETEIVHTSPKMHKHAEFLAKYLKNNGDVLVQTSEKYTGKNQIVLKENIDLGEEAYHITVSKDHIVCEASTPAGMFYATQTLIQSFDLSDKTLTVPCVSIKDAPRYAWRGFMLDEARHFFGKETVKQILDVMAYLKLNRFHWHLTDGTGWRIEIKKYPNLTEIGAVGNFSDQNAPRQFYTQDEIREIVAYASERHIMVIPEIDMPGHADAAYRSYPEFFLAHGDGVHGVFHPAREATYQFIDYIFTEIVQLFPSPYIHAGGDEVSFDHPIWAANPEIQQFIKEHDLKDVDGLLYYFMRRVCDIVNSKGCAMIGWQEMIPSGVAPGKAIPIWWMNHVRAPLYDALEKGFKVIMTPHVPCYLDYKQHQSHILKHPAWSHHVNSLLLMYSFPDYLSSLVNSHRDQIMGIQAHLWTELIADSKRLYFMMFPRLAGMAESAWTNAESKDYFRFENNLKKFFQYLDQKGINYFNPFHPELTPEPWGPTW